MPIVLGEDGKKTLLCFFRDAACPFCIYRIVELTQSYSAFSALGLEIIAVFTSTPAAVNRFVTRHRRPFRVVADPSSQAHNLFRVERSTLRKLKGILTRIPTLLKGLRYVGLAGLNTTNLMPAEFLIDEYGRIITAHYGKDPGDRLPIDTIELILARSIIAKAKKRAREESGKRPTKDLAQRAPISATAQ